MTDMEGKGLIRFVAPRTTRKLRHIDVKVHDLHVDIVVNGRITFTSENYASPAKARRAARAFVDAVNTRPMRLVYWMGRMGSMVRYSYLVRKPWVGPGNRPVAMPVDTPE